MATTIDIDSWQLYGHVRAAVAAAAPDMDDAAVNRHVHQFMRESGLAVVADKDHYTLRDVALLWCITTDQAMTFIRWGVISPPTRSHRQPDRWGWRGREWDSVVAVWRIMYHLQLSDLDNKERIILAQASALTHTNLTTIHKGLFRWGKPNRNRIITVDAIAHWAMNNHGAAVYLADPTTPEVRLRIPITADTIIAARDHITNHQHNR